MNQTSRIGCVVAVRPQDREFLALPGMHGNLVPDAHLAALAVEHGLTLCSTDGNFSRSRLLRWLNPNTP